MTSPSEPSTTALTFAQARLNPLLEQTLLQTQPSSNVLADAIRYSLLANSKRLRPALVWASVQSLGGDPRLGDRAAIAVECIHTYSLIHDDLPAMDDDDLRRGQPSCHIKFGEAQAILAGDALQTCAFEALAGTDWPMMAQSNLAASITALARASGPQGMVDGQSLDLLAENQTLGSDALSQIHSRKTGALIRAACELGGLSANADPMQLDLLIEFGESLGLAFQIQDDVLDATETTQNLGKPAGSDAEQDKSTFVDLLGIDACRTLVSDLLAQSEQSIKRLPNPAPLTSICRQMAHRNA